MALAPVDYGPQTQPDTSGLQAQQQAVAQQSQVFAEAKKLGEVIQGGSQVVTQGILHTQALKATAAVKERQASTLQFIDSNPYIPKAVLQQRMRKEDYELWHASLATEYHDKEAVPMFTAGGALFDSEAHQAREAAGSTISLPGWRGAWDATERTESATIRERYVNRMMADQMIADQRAQSLTAIDRMVDAAVKPQDLDVAARAAETNPWLKPAERRVVREKVLVSRDSFVSEQAMLAGDTEVMKAQLAKLKGPTPEQDFPNMNVKQRLALEQRLAREYGFKAVRELVDKTIIGPNVDENGKLDHEEVEAALAAYTGDNKAEVVKATRAEMNERDNIFNAKMADLQKVVFTAGQDPKTGEFSMRRAQQDTEAREAAERLNEDAPGLLTALAKEDQRNVNIAARETALERREARAKLVDASNQNLENIHRVLDDPAASAEWRDKTPAQFDALLYSRDMVESDRQKARKAFADFSKRGKPDERPQVSVANEIKAAAKGDPTKIKELSSKYSDVLLQAAHAFVRANPDLPPDKMTDELRKLLRTKMLEGTVVGSSTWVRDDRTRLINWEVNAATNKDWRGKDFKLPDGTVIKARSPVLTSPDGKQKMTFAAEDEAAARADGWK